MSATDEIKARIGNRRVIASVSGGKDSAAMCLHLRETGISFSSVFIDTGWEHPLTYEYVRGPLTAMLGPIVEIRGKHDMPSLVRSKGMFASRQIQFCTEELKADVIKAYLSALMDAGDDVINAVGIRRSESANRAAAPEWEWSDRLDCEVFRPLVAWTIDDVIAIHQRHGLAPNPLYLKGFSRVGCFPCKNWKKDEIQLGAEMWPARFFGQIGGLERETISKARSRYDRYLVEITAGRGDALSAQARRMMLAPDGSIKPFFPPTFFQAPTGYSGPLLTVERVVEWSRTKRGGKVEDRQIDMLDAMGVNDGCMRWGLCETSEAESPTLPAKQGD